LNCPNCGTVIEADFGMVTCSRCHVVVFVDINGEAHLNSPDPLAESAPAPEPLEPFLAEEPEQSFEPAQAYDLQHDPELEPTFDPQQGSEPVQEPESFPEPLPELNFEQYANAEKDLPALSYTVRISGLEHPQKLKEALEILREPRLALDEQLIQQVKSTGNLDLERLTAVKASYLVKMLLLKRIPVTWRQNVFN
jgi:hypothetical protein